MKELIKYLKLKDVEFYEVDDREIVVPIPVNKILPNEDVSFKKDIDRKEEEYSKFCCLGDFVNLHISEENGHLSWHALVGEQCVDDYLEPIEEE